MYYYVSWLHCDDGRAKNGLSLPRFHGRSPAIWLSGLKFQIDATCLYPRTHQQDLHCVSGRVTQALVSGLPEAHECSRKRGRDKGRFSLEWPFFSQCQMPKRDGFIMWSLERSPVLPTVTPTGRMVSLWNQHKEGVIDPIYPSASF